MKAGWLRAQLDLATKEVGQWPRGMRRFAEEQGVIQPHEDQAMTSDTFTDASIDNRCVHCGLHHGPACPRVKSIEYHENGAVKRVEYRDDYFVQPAPASTNNLHYDGCYGDGR